jgi:hypothetical protein
MDNQQKFRVRLGSKNSRDLVVYYNDGEATISFRPYDDPREKRRVKNLITTAVSKSGGELTDAFDDGPHHIVRFSLPDVAAFRQKYEVLSKAA